MLQSTRISKGKSRVNKFENLFLFLIMNTGAQK